MAAFAFSEKLTTDTKACICCHVSNVFGYIQPVERIAALCRERGIPLILDTAQGAGSCPIDFTALGASFIAMPGHKGLYGPQGTGLLLCGMEKPKPLLAGGTGSASLSYDMPDFLPDRLEAGTHNMPGIAGLLAGIRYVQRRRPERILERERRLVALAQKGLADIRGAISYGSPHQYAQGGVLSFNLWDVPCEIVAQELGRRHIAVRAGYHCAPEAHRSAGTLDTGTVRLSVSDFNTPAEIYHFLNHLEDIEKKLRQARQRRKEDPAKP